MPCNPKMRSYSIAPSWSRCGFSKYANTRQAPPNAKASDIVWCAWFSGCSILGAGLLCQPEDSVEQQGSPVRLRQWRGVPPITQKRKLSERYRGIVPTRARSFWSPFRLRKLLTPASPASDLFQCWENERGPSSVGDAPEPEVASGPCSLANPANGSRA